MGLSAELISQFAKITNDNKKKTNTETTVYGKTVEHNGTIYVRLDGATDILTPVTTTTNVKPNERVTVSIKDHTATITGNMTSPSASSSDVKNAIDQITEFEIVITDKLNAETARIDTLVADNVTIKDSLTVAKADIDILQAANLTVTEKIEADEAEIENLKATKLDASVANATFATIESLEATDAKVYNLEATYSDFVVTTTEKLNANTASINDLKANKADVSALNAATAKIGILEANKADITDLDAVEARVEVLEAGVADIDTLIFGSATGDTIQTSFSNSVIAQVGDAQIKSAMIEDVSADKITAGDIITNDVRVMSEDGSLVISDETMQISDETRVRVQIGKDSTGDYSINVWDVDGNLMFSKGGITDSAIKQAIIRNDMVSDTANIAAHKLDIDSLFEEINGSTKTINSTRIYLDDEKQTLDVAFESMSSDVKELQNGVSSQGTQITAIQGQIASKVWQQDIDTATNEMSTQYTSLEQEVDSISATVAGHTSEMSDVNDKVTSLEVDLEGFQTSVSETYVKQVDLEAVTNRVESAETTIQQNTEAIGLSATKIELSEMSEILSVSGRNLIVRRNELTDTYVTASGEITPCETSYRSATMADPIRIEAGETYTFSKDESVANLYFRWAWFDSDMNVLGRTADNAASFSWTAPENAAYVIVSYPYTDGANPKMEKGSEATEYCPAIEDVGEAIESVDAKFANYSTTTEMNAAIQLSADSITSQVSKKYTTKTELQELEIGGRNLIKNSNFADGTAEWVVVGLTATIESDDTHGKCLKMTSPEVGSSEYRVYPSTTTNFIHSGGTYSLSFYAKAGAETSIQTNVAGASGTYKNHSLTTEWTRYSFTYDASGGSITFWPNEVDVAVYITKVKMEHGDKVTDWTLAPEDVENDIVTAQTSADNAQSTADSAQSLATTAESLVQQLSDSISMLVTDGNGQSLMTQTDTGWTFSTGELQSIVDSTSENLDALTNEVGDVNSAVGVLQQAVDDLGILNDYVKIGTYEDEPCIELGEMDSDFKLLITNTRIMFMEGTGVPAYINNQSLHIKKAVIEEELQQGEFVWKARSNGNLGLIWKGVTS